MTSETSQRWSLSRPAFDRLLLRLAEEPEKAAREYEAIRHALLVFFDVRGIADSAAMADEALDRVARRLEQGEQVDRPRAYVYGVARNLVRESIRQRCRERSLIEAQQTLVALAAAPDPNEGRIACLERCLGRLPEQSRALIVGYYQDHDCANGKRRQFLARRLGITYASLKTRAHRIRNALEICLHECLKTTSPGNQ
jgi:DNA-directed RNA polymerase specialized sigma24 family protein